jgi:predicted Fe-Mo cluster-binding NifX family protein
MAYKIAIITEDKHMISSHFGMAPLYQVFEVEGGKILSEDERSKPHHEQHPHGEGHPGGHADMFAPIADCKVLLSGGMGEPAFEKARRAGLEVVLTGGEIRQAVQKRHAPHPPSLSGRKDDRADSKKKGIEKPASDPGHGPDRRRAADHWGDRDRSASQASRA